jgi:hypothetical protein
VAGSYQFSGGKIGPSSNSAISSAVIGANASGSKYIRPFIDPGTRAGWTPEVSGGAQFGHGQVVAADHYDLTQLRQVNVTQQMRPSLL